MHLCNKRFNLWASPGYLVVSWVRLCGAKKREGGGINSAWEATLAWRMAHAYPPYELLYLRLSKIYLIVTTPDLNY
jgi:hypothetical protein